MYKKLILALILLVSGVTFSGCSKNLHTVRVVKPKKHWLPYNQKKHHKRKRTKIVRMRS